MAETDERIIKLQVAGAQQQDVGKGTARLGDDAFAELDLQKGQVVEIMGERTTAAIALPPYPQDEGLPIIRIDGLIRANADVRMGDHIRVRPADAKPAQRVVLAPAQQNIQLHGSGRALLQTLHQRPLVAGDVVSTSVYRRTPGMDQRMFPEEVFREFFERRTFGLQEIRLSVVSTRPKGIVQVTQDTEIELRPQYVEPEEPRSTDVTYDDIGGLQNVIDQVREMIELPLKHPVLFQRLGIDPPKGILLHGPPGTGKTLLARAVACEAEAHFSHIAGPEIMGRYYGESEERIREVFTEAQQSAPAIIFIDEIARELNAPLDVFVVRKLGTPGQPELAMGAIASGGIRILNDRIIQSLKIPQTAIDDAMEREERELRRRQQTFRGDRDPIPLEGKVVILVDDGLATGASMKAAVEVVHASNPKKLIVAVGTAPPDTLREFKRREDVDDVVCLVSPAMFYGVGGAYENFAQTTDDQVRACLT